MVALIDATRPDAGRKFMSRYSTVRQELATSMEIVATRTAAENDTSQKTVDGQMGRVGLPSIRISGFTIAQDKVDVDRLWPTVFCRDQMACSREETGW